MINVEIIKTLRGKIKRLVVLDLIIVGVFFGGHLFAGSVFDQAVDTAIDSRKAEVA